MPAPSTITQDPFIKGLVDRIPAKHKDSFSDEQLLSLKIALSGRRWGRHAIDLRGAFGFWHWRYYYVIVGGRERRQLSSRERKIALIANATIIFGFFTFSALFGLLILYLMKSALGINLLPGYSLGIWDWFKDTFL
jgi:hypothetical protein